MDSSIKQASPSTPPTERHAYCGKISRELRKWPAHALSEILRQTEDLMHTAAPPDARVAGFEIINGILENNAISENLRSKLIQATLAPIRPDGVEYQIQTLAVALQSQSGLGSSVDIVWAFVLGTIQNQFNAQNSARRHVRSQRRDGAPESPPEELGMHALLNFVTAFVRKEPTSLNERRLITLLQEILSVAEKASATGTIERVCLVIRSIIAVSRVPYRALHRCVEDLCAIFNTTQRLKDVTWDCIMLLIESERQDEYEVVSIILDAIGKPNQERQAHTVCGAIRTARFIITHQGVPRIPILSFARLLAALRRIHYSSRRIRKECLRTLSILLNDERMVRLIVEEADWTPMLEVMCNAVGKQRRFGESGIPIEDLKMPHSEAANVSISSDGDIQQGTIDDIRHIADSFLKLWAVSTAHQHTMVAKILRVLQAWLPDGYNIGFVLALCELCVFSGKTSGWLENLVGVIKLFYFDREAEAALKCTVLKILKAACEHVGEYNKESFHRLMLELLIEFQSKKDLQVGNALADLVITESKTSWAPKEYLGQFLDLAWPLLSVPDDPRLPEDIYHAASIDHDNANTAAISFVELFLHVVNNDGYKAAAVFDLLVSIAHAQHLPSSARLPAVRLLTRIRCSLWHGILIITSPDIQGLASTLCRTESTAPGLQSQTIAQPASASSPTDGKSDHRAIRHSGISSRTQSTARSSARASARVDRQTRPKPPLWLYPGGPALPLSPPVTCSHVLRRSAPNVAKESTIHLGDWLVTTISILQQPATDWEIYSYVLVHLPAQLSNRELFSGSSPHIGLLRRVIVDQLLEGAVYEPPHDTGVRKGDVAYCLYHTLIMLVGYSESFQRKEQERIVQAFFLGISEWERTAQFCIQALTICCYALPSALTVRLSAILQKMSQMITQAPLTVDILEFLANLARHKHLHVNFREEEFRMVFAICVRYLEHSREQRLGLLTDGDRATTLTPVNIGSSNPPDRDEKIDLIKDLPQYVFALAYHVLTAWFLSVRISDRNDHVGWITKNLAWRNASGEEIMEEQGQVTLDMMLRTSYLDLGETEPRSPFTEIDGPVLSKTWLLGISIVTIETATSTGLSRVTKRQASGTTYAIYKPQTTELPPHHERCTSEGHGSEIGISVFPNHILLQLASSIAPIPAPMEPICLPDDVAVRRAISAFDRNDTVDGYKVGVIFVGSGQTSEAAILGNTYGSPIFERFLNDLGVKVVLQNAKFNTQGLDKELNLDGTHTYAWRDRVTEMIFHVPTMMPTDAITDPQCINKKRHIGNDYVNIIWNESGHSFRFDTFASQFNCVNIVIVPDAIWGPRRSFVDEWPEAGSNTETFCTIQVLTAASFPSLSPASCYKLLSLKTLPLLARQLALQASLFSNVWMNRETGEHASNWRNRLRDIKRLRDRYANTSNSTSFKYPGVRSLNTYSTGDSFHGQVSMGGLIEREEGLVASLDFSRWAGPNGPSGE